MTNQTRLQYQEVPSIGLYIAITKALDERGISIANIIWYDTKLLIQKQDLLLSSREWSEARAFFEVNHPEIAIDMITGPAEWTDSLIAYPSNDGNYAHNLNVKLPKIRNKVPLVIQGSVVEKRGDNYIIDGGEVLELPSLPRISGRLLEEIPELGLNEGVYMWIDSNFDYEQGLRPVIRSFFSVASNERRFDAKANRGPLYSVPYVGFRPARRVVKIE